MSTLPTIAEPEQTSPLVHAPVHAEHPLLLCLPSMPADAASAVLAHLAAAFPAGNILVASPDQDTEQPAAPGRPPVVPYPQPRGNGHWVLTAEDYAAAARLTAERGASGAILLGNDAGSLHPEALQAIASALASGTDLALPRYQTVPDEALVNSALLYPLTRALFSIDARFPLPLDAGLSPRLAARLAETANRSSTQTEGGLLWPVAEAAIAGFSVRQVKGGVRNLPQPQEGDFNELFPVVTSAIFADIEAKATYWQRARSLPAPRHGTPRTSAPPEHAPEEVRALVESFRIAFNNLREIWSLVLPPQSLLALKKLASSSPESFTYPPSLWARTVYDFALAFHLRTLNRGHLLGSLTPLYLAWVASFLRESDGDNAVGDGLLDVTASAFEQEKSYLVSRWRWPDRFNP